MKYLFSSLPEEKRLKSFITSMRRRKSYIPYKSKILKIKHNEIGYFVRMYPVPHKKRNSSEEFQFHADCLLPGGGLASYGYDPIESLEVEGFRSKFEKGLTGQILFGSENDSKFIDAQSAMLCRCISSFLIFSVSRPQAERFRRFWTHPPQRYNRFSSNCSSLPFMALHAAGIFKKSLTNPITPRRLFNYLRSDLEENRHGKFLEGAGFLGFRFDSNEMEIRTPRELEVLAC